MDLKKRNNKTGNSNYMGQYLKLFLLFKIFEKYII